MYKGWKIAVDLKFDLQKWQADSCKDCCQLEWSPGLKFNPQPIPYMLKHFSNSCLCSLCCTYGVMLLLALQELARRLIDGDDAILDCMELAEVYEGNDHYQTVICLAVSSCMRQAPTGPSNDAATAPDAVSAFGASSCGSGSGVYAGNKQVDDAGRIFDWPGGQGGVDLLMEEGCGQVLEEKLREVMVSAAARLRRVKQMKPAW